MIVKVVLCSNICLLWCSALIWFCCMRVLWLMITRISGHSSLNPFFLNPGTYVLGQKCNSYAVRLCVWSESGLSIETTFLWKCLRCCHQGRTIVRTDLVHMMNVEQSKFTANPQIKATNLVLAFTWRLLTFAPLFSFSTDWHLGSITWDQWKRSDGRVVDDNDKCNKWSLWKRL